MAGQGPSRRELLQAMTVAATASAFTGFSRWSFAHAQSMPQHERIVSSQVQVRPDYTPQFFTLAEYRTLDHLTDLILPADYASSSSQTVPAKKLGQPGARDVGVAEFVDFIVFNDPTLQPRFRSGLKWLDQAALPSSSFVDLKPTQQHALLDRLAYAKQHRSDEKPGQEFFALARRYTVMGFYTTREGLQSLDFPGLRFYATSPGCTHTDNPEHAGL